MEKVGVIGLGDMGSGLALNLVKSGFEVHGFDVDDVRMEAFESMGGHRQTSAAAVGVQAQKVFIMVMTGAQAKSVIFGGEGEAGLLSSMPSGSTIILSATIRADEVAEIAAGLGDSGVNFIDSPVSGGFPGAQAGTLTMMAAATDDVLKECENVMQAVSASIHIVGDCAGMGQTVKACLQSLIGSIFSATFEASVLAAKSGVSGEVLHKVVSSSSAGCGVANTALENIIDRKFEKTGSHIATMYKDLTIVMDLARNKGVPLFTASTAMQLFQAGITRYPDGDNWSVTQISEDIVDARLHR